MDATRSAALRELLPQQAPFRFVDVVEACDAGRSVRARWRISGREPWLAGHFPGHPIVPGVLLVEALAQAGTIAVLSGSAGDSGRIPLFAGLDGVRFRRAVEPPADVVLDVTVERMSGLGGSGSGRASVAGVEVCSGRLRFVMATPPGG